MDEVKEHNHTASQTTEKSIRYLKAENRGTEPIKAK